MCVSLPVPGFSPADLHSVPDPDPTRNVSQRLDRHAVGHQQVRQYIIRIIRVRRMRCMKLNEKRVAARSCTNISLLCLCFSPCADAWSSWGSTLTLSLPSYSVIITTVLYLSDALRKNFLNDKFDYKVGGTLVSQSRCLMNSVNTLFCLFFSTLLTQTHLFFVFCRCGTRTSICLWYLSTSPAYSWSPSPPPRGRRRWKSGSCLFAKCTHSPCFTTCVRMA